MKTYDVTVTKDVTKSAVIQVEADSPEEAQDKALLIARGAIGPEVKWEADDCEGDDPYIADEDEAAVEVDNA